MKTSAPHNASSLRTQGPITTVVCWSRRRWPPCQNERPRRRDERFALTLGSRRRVRNCALGRDDIEIMHSRDPLARNDGFKTLPLCYLKTAFAGGFVCSCVKTLTSAPRRRALASVDLAAHQRDGALMD